MKLDKTHIELTMEDMRFLYEEEPKTWKTVNEAIQIVCKAVISLAEQDITI